MGNSIFDGGWMTKKKIKSNRYVDSTHFSKRSRTVNIAESNSRGKTCNSLAPENLIGFSLPRIGTKSIKLVRPGIRNFYHFPIRMPPTQFSAITGTRTLKSLGQYSVVIGTVIENQVGCSR